MIRARLRQVRRDERGFTLTELLTAVAIGMVVIIAATNLIDASVRASGDVLDRVEALQKGRAALEQLTQRLRSQVCPDKNTPAIVAGSNSSMTFYTELGGETFAPEGRRITLDGTGKLTEETWSALASPFANTFGVAPTTTRVIATELAPQPGVPFFRYYTFVGLNPAKPTLQLQTPLSAADMARVVKVTASFDSRPSKRSTTQNRLDTSLENEVFVRTADPTDPEHSPQCE